ncbi:hypothetical protein B0H19DRAFT_1335305 [Mycena capillaripes]|nr:hypothetical protein B0H19DRAFT_1335305 [Mycena capillaripes]
MLKTNALHMKTTLDNSWTWTVKHSFDMKVVQFQSSHLDGTISGQVPSPARLAVTDSNGILVLQIRRLGSHRYLLLAPKRQTITSEVTIEPNVRHGRSENVFTGATKNSKEREFFPLSYILNEFKDLIPAFLFERGTGMFLKLALKDGWRLMVLSRSPTSTTPTHGCRTTAKGSGIFRAEERQRSTTTSLSGKGVSSCTTLVENEGDGVFDRTRAGNSAWGILALRATLITQDMVHAEPPSGTPFDFRAVTASP